MSDENGDAEIVRVMTNIKAMREDIAQWREKAERAQADLALTKQQYESTRQNLVDVTAKYEYHQRQNLGLITKMNDLEMFIYSELERLDKAANTGANTLIGAVNATAETVKRFLDDLHTKQNGPTKLQYAGDLTAVDEARLKDLSARLAIARPQDGGKAS